MKSARRANVSGVGAAMSSSFRIVMLGTVSPALNSALAVDGDRVTTLSAASFVRLFTAVNVVSADTLPALMVSVVADSV